jgi:methionine-rich copper-binding protein CopC
MRIAQLILVTALALAGLVFSTGSASAHARYESSEPADGSTVADSPERIDIWFTQEVRRTGGLPTITVVNDSGDTVSQDTVLDDDDRTHMYVDLVPALAPGRYTAIWHAISDEDDHDGQGAFHYFVGEPSDATPTPGDTATATPTPTLAGPTATPTPPPSTPEPTPTPPPPDTADDDSGDIPIWGLIVGIAAGLVVGGGATWAVRRP